MKNKGKILALFLSLTIAFTFMPSAAFAVEDAGLGADNNYEVVAAEETSITEDGLTDAPQEAGDTQSDESVNAQQFDDSAQKIVTISTDDISEETAISQKRIALPAGDELLEGFLEKEASKSAKLNQASISSKNTRGSKLKGNDKAMYDGLTASIKKIADGKSESTIISIPLTKLAGGQVYFTAEDLGVEAIVVDGEITEDAKNALFDKFDFESSKLLSALLADMPYDLYWFDKTKGFDGDLTDGQMWAEIIGGTWKIYYDSAAAWTLNFYVSKDYSSTGAAGTTDIDKTKTTAAKKAAQNAGTIVKNNSAKNDLPKLQEYKDEICDRVSYDNTGLNPSTPYGDIWQMIYVFDGDTDTNVVCEGYSKAFQFLCDLSEFRRSEVMSHIVTGDMLAGNEAEAEKHMWNIVHMENGRNYIVDVTNCDEDTVGYPDDLFMKGCSSGSVSTGYVYSPGESTVKYIYDAATRGIYEDSELEMEDSEYTGPLPPGSTGTCGDNLTWALTGTDTNKTLTISGTGAMYDYDDDPSPWGADNAIKNLVIGSGLTSIGADAFDGCDALEYIFYAGTKAQWQSLGHTDCGDAVVHYNSDGGHTWDSDYTVDRPATCTEKGSESIHCTQCSAVKEGSSIDIAPLGHSYNSYVAVNPTEDAEGATAHSCTRCGYTYYTAIARIVLPTDLPKVSIKKPSAAKKKMTVKWKKPKKGNLAKIDGIEIQVNGPGYSATFTSGKKKTSRKVSGLQSKRKYNVRVRAYKYIGGEKHVSVWSGWKSAKIK